MRFPSISTVAQALRSINARTDAGAPDQWGEREGCAVRLQVYPDGRWAVRYGLSDYDLDHHGVWGSSSVPASNRRFKSRDTARDLIKQCRDSAEDAKYWTHAV